MRLLSSFPTALLASASMLLLSPLTVHAFVAPSSSLVNPRAATTSTPTTLYYRDDVPPIGSSPHWETPNDFNQFLTQCSIQSFMFLLHSLRDEHTMQWIHDFTDPVIMTQQQQQQQQQALAAATSTTPAKPKVSLAEAAQSALMHTEKDLADFEEEVIESKTKTTSPSKKEKKKQKVSKKLSKKQQVKEDKKQVKATKAAAKKEASLRKKKFVSVSAFKHVVTSKKVSPKTARSMVFMSQLLEEKAAIKSAFSHHTVGMYLALARKENRPIVNTDISELYSSLPKKASASPPTVKKSFAPFGTGKKHKPVPASPFTERPFATKKNTAVATSRNNNPSKNGGPPSRKKNPLATTATGTLALYDAPKKTPKSKEVNNNDESNNDSTTFPKKSNPVALKYHGLAILNRTRFPTWDSYFEQLLEQPKESYTVESYHGRTSYEMDIDPASLVRRMLSVRMQIAEEFEHDLEVIANMGGLTLKSYQKMLREIREQRAEDELQQQKDTLGKQFPKSMEDAISQNNGAASTDDVENGKPTNAPKPSVQRANLHFLGSAVGSGSSADLSPSPLRKGNFDLLCLLATQEAIHRVLNDKSRQARKSPEHGSNQFLQDFYVTRLLSHFSGDQKYGRSDDFLEELLECPPRMITVGGSSSAGGDKKKSNDGAGDDELTKDLTYLVDPLKVAEIIVNKREKVALEWKEQLAEQTKADHMELQKLILAKVMGGTVDECEIVDPEGKDVEDDGLGSCFE